MSALLTGGHCGSTRITAFHRRWYRNHRHPHCRVDCEQRPDPRPLLNLPFDNRHRVDCLSHLLADGRGLN